MFCFHLKLIFLAQYPKQFDYNLHFIHLIEDIDITKNIGHITVPFLIKSFNALYGTFCVYCRKTFLGRNMTHFCKKHKHCSSCSRFLLSPEIDYAAEDSNDTLTTGGFPIEIKTKRRYFSFHQKKL